jgi:ATP-binding protein involved in chromosome partitioning
MASSEDIHASRLGRGGAPTPPLHHLSEATVLEALRGVVDPELGDNVVDLGMIRSVELKQGDVTVEIALTVASCPLRDQLRNDVEAHLGALPGVSSVDIRIGAMSKDERAALMSRARKVAQERSSVSDLAPSARVLGIVSGKGGVGKSSVAVNLAVALARRGLHVGLLDGDIWGFSVPRMLGIDGPLEVRDKKMIPHELRIEKGLLKVISMGFLSGEDEAIMWRGLVLNRAVQHFLEDVAWGDLDYLVVDMPPGTGDVQMGLARMVPRTELLIVTTPAFAAQKVAGRAADMARKGHLRVAGVIENMSSLTCDHGTLYAIFGEGGGERLAKDIGVPLVASVPIDKTMSRGGDAGLPAALDEKSPLKAVFAALAEKITSEIAPVVSMTDCSARILAAVESTLSAASR